MKLSHDKNHIIREALQEIDCDANWRLSGPIIKSRQCDIFRAISEKSGLILAVKLFSTDVNPAAPQQQFQALQRYQPAMTSAEAGFQIPKVFFYDSQKRLLIMEWVAGKSLHRCLWKISVKRGNQGQTLLHKTGRWLRLFHEASSPVSKEVNFADYLFSIEQRIAQYPSGTLPSGQTLQGFSESFNYLQQEISRLPVTHAPHALAHGDFTPFNLLLDERRTIGLDIWASVRKPVHNDLVRMITYLTIAYPLLTRQPAFNDTGHVAKQLTPLLDGYGSDLVDPASELFKISLLAEYLRRWLAIDNRPQSIKGIMTDRYQISQIKKQVGAITTLTLST